MLLSSYLFPVNLDEMPDRPTVSARSYLYARVRWTGRPACFTVPQPPYTRVEVEGQESGVPTVPATPHSRSVDTGL